MFGHRSTGLAHLFVAMLTTGMAAAQTPPTGIRVPVVSDPVVSVHFSDLLRPWDGFGVNYVETAQTRDYEAWPQEYGGFSLLDEGQRDEILQLIFGDDGLRPGLTKLFLDPWHEGRTAAGNDNGDPAMLNQAGFDHETTTRWMRYFNREGLRRTRARGDDLVMMTTLYGPPPWMTRQKFLLGRDLDPSMGDELVEYMVSWIRYLRDDAGLPVSYLSLHNEGDAYYRWPRDGSNPGEDHRDYNMLWPPAQVVDFLMRTRRALDAASLSSVGMTPGETQTWYRFDEWGYARAILAEPAALRSLGLVTSHSFANYQDITSTYYGDYRSVGIDALRERLPDLHAWVTSMSWGAMDATFVDAIRRNIYISKVNGIIPWAIVQRASQWVGGDPNPGTGIRVNEDSTYTVLPGYYYYKQVTLAGRPGTWVAAVTSLDPDVGIIAFAGTDSGHPDAFVLINLEDEPKNADIAIAGSDFDMFEAYRTSETDRFARIGIFRIDGTGFRYEAPPRSVTTFFGIR